MKKFKVLLTVIFANLLFNNIASANKDSIQNFDYSPILSIEYASNTSSAVDYFGFGAYFVKNNDFGFYVNSLTNETFLFPTYDNTDAKTFGDPIIKRFNSTNIFNIGATYGVSTNFNLYGGIGFADVYEVQERQDSTYSLSPDGRYFVKFQDQSDTSFNYNLGLLLSIGSFNLNIGYQDYLKSGYLGLGYRF